MPYYLSTERVATRRAPQGRPSWARAWEPFGSQEIGTWQDRKWLWLGRTEQALIWIADAISDARLILLAEDAAEELASATLTRLASRCNDGRTIEPSRSFAEAIFRILRQPPANLSMGKALRSSRRRGRWELHLGPRNQGPIWSEIDPEIRSSTVTWTDNFNRTENLNGSSLSGGGGATWAEIEGTAWTVNGSVALVGATAGTFNVAWVAADTDTDDQYVQVDGAWGGGTASYPGVGLRLQGASGNEGYGAEAGSGNDWRVYYWDDDSNIDSGAGTSSPDTLYFEFDGSSYDFQLNGSSVSSGTDATFTGHLRVGITGFTLGGGSFASVDNFDGGDLGTAPETGQPTMRRWLNVPHMGGQRRFSAQGI